MPTEEPGQEVADAAELYSLPLDQFTAARDRLARSLRSENRGDEADTVAKLRKPSVAAWALNRASRQNPELVGRLQESHRKLREADSMEILQSASQARRSAISALVEAAETELRADGRADSLQTRDRIRSTLLAAATDAEAENQLQAGCLVRDLEPSGSGWDEMGMAPIRADPMPRAAAAATQARARADRLEKEVTEAERQLDIAERAVKEARRRAKNARTRYQKALTEAAEAEENAGKVADRE